MSKDFSNGNKHGHEDGKQGENRLASRAFKRFLQIDQILPGAENRHDEYRRGYLTGFEDEVRVIHTDSLTHSQNQGIKTMAKSFAHQTQLLSELKTFLGQFQQRLESVSNSYRNKIELLHDEGELMDETYRDFVQEQLEPTQDLIKKLIEHIEYNDIPAVQKAINDIEPFL
jgi:hypothetical protein